MLKLVFAGLALGGAGGVALWELGATPAEFPVVEDVADNGPEGAWDRWRTSQPTHWRHVVTPSD
jgi:hypothetical protein